MASEREELTPEERRESDTRIHELHDRLMSGRALAAVALHEAFRVGMGVQTARHAADRAALVQDRDEWQQVSRDWRYRAETAEAELRQQKEDRAALVAQLEAARAAPQDSRRKCRKCGGDGQDGFGGPCDCVINGKFASIPTHAALVAQVAELTRERDEALETVCAMTDLASRENAEVTRLTEALHEVQQAHTNANSNLQLAEARCTRLTEALAAAERALANNLPASYWNGKASETARAAEARVRELEEDYTRERKALYNQAVAAEARVRELEAELEQCREASHVVSDELDEERRQHDLTRESRLAAANALLERVLRCSDPAEETPFEEIQEHLAAQPATAPARDEGEGCGRTCYCGVACGGARTEAEQAVLDALCDPSSGEWVCGDWLTETQAELLNAAISARRGAGRG